MSNLRTWGTRQDRYAYKRLMEGLEYHEKKGDSIRFLTITGVCKGQGYRNNFNSLRRWIRGNYGQFSYFSIRTDEGLYGVIHILFAGKSIRWGDIKKFWKGRTGFWTVSISKVETFGKICIEMTRQQKAVRYSQSRGWQRKYEYQKKL